MVQDSGEAGKILKEFGASRDKILSALVGIRRAQRITDPNPEEKYQALEKSSRDLTDLARKGKLDPVIGRMTDGQGRTVDFKNTVIIMTSNLGSQYIQDLSDGKRQDMERLVTAALRDAFKPEFLSRIDEVIIFNSLGREEIKSIVGIQLKRLRQDLANRKMALEIADRAKALLADKGYDPVYGARPLKRTIQRLIQDPLAVKIPEGEFKEGDRIKIDSDGDGLIFSHHEATGSDEDWAQETLH
jgi:ATP-dependent Clp protease ATP-binding subunit ClpA